MENLLPFSFVEQAIQAGERNRGYVGLVKIYTKTSLRKYLQL